MATFLVTGCAGFIGSRLVYALLRQNHRVVGLDDFSIGSKTVLADALKNPLFTLIEGSIEDSEMCKKATENCEFVLHHAAIASVQASMENPLNAHNINVNGTLNMLIASEKNNVKRFVFPSSAAVYGDATISPKHELLLPEPKSPYAVQKLTAEGYCRYFAEHTSLKTIVFRYFNVYGPGQSPTSQYSGVISKFIDAFEKKSPPIVYGDGSQIRDFVFVDDVVAANIRCCLQDIPHFGLPMNIGSGKPVSLMMLISELQQLFKTDLAPVYQPFRAGDIKESLSDIGFAQKQFGFSPSFQLKDGLKQIIESHGVLE